MNQLQIMFINVLNSKYRILTILGLYFTIYVLFYLNSTALCTNGDVGATSESWRELFYASQEKVRKLETTITSLKDENFDLSIENYALQTQLEEQKLQIEALEYKNLILTNEINTERNILAQAQEELLNTKSAYTILENQLQEYKTLTRQIRCELSESKTEINALKQKYAHTQDFTNVENLNKRQRKL
jgi:chromosome segregation ATPase